ncbi:uncharacterized protein LOC132469185 [Gadus macrocephalus]|uniref:uncharacterized protein LOC132469185 n=1 Tax=Gadus macrocephalus TaxID=80720 RepID=UPI0028CB7847|nr:uncharacterized protein LOC132469185 [Gadus macrocephalus]
MNPGRKKTVRRKDSLFSTTCERSGNVMKICVNLMPALALSQDPLDPEEESRDHSHRFSLKEKTRIPASTNEERKPEKDKASNRRGDLKRTVLTFNGATRVHLNPAFVLPPIMAKSNNTLWRRPVYYDHAKTVVSTAPPNQGGAALSRHGGVSRYSGVSSLGGVSYQGGVYDMGSVYIKGWVSDQGGVSSQGRVCSQGVVYDQSGVSNQSGVSSLSGASSQGGLCDQGGVSIQVGVSSHSGVNDQSGVSSQSGVYDQSGVSSQSGVSTSSQDGVYNKDRLYDQGGVSSQDMVSCPSGVYDPSGVSDKGVSSQFWVCNQSWVSAHGVSSQSGVSNPGGVTEQNERLKAREYTPSSSDGPPDTRRWTDRTLSSERRPSEPHLPDVSLASLRLLLHGVTSRVGRRSTSRRGGIGGVHWSESGSVGSSRLSLDRTVLQRLRGSRLDEERLGSAGKGRVLLPAGDRGQARLRPRLLLPPICPGNRPPVLLTMSTGNPPLLPSRTPHPQRRPPMGQTQEETALLKQYIF